MRTALAVALLAVASASAASQHAAAGSASPDPHIGKPAPGLSADAWLPETPVTTGKVVLLDFWATWCGPCIAQFPTMRQWQERFGSDLVIVGMTNLEGQTAEEIRAFVAREKLPWPVAIDNDGITHRAFGVVPLPHTFLIDRKGIVRTAHVGGRGFADLLPELEQLIGER